MFLGDIQISARLFLNPFSAPLGGKEMSAQLEKVKLPKAGPIAA